MGDWQKWKAWFAERRHSHDSEEIAVRAMDACDTIQSLTTKLERVKDAIRVAFEDLENFDDAGALEALRQALKDIENG